MRGDEAMTLPMDLGSVLLDGRQHWFVAHLVARRSWWRGRVVAVMNAQWIGPWDVAPRSHPNDGLLDVFDGDLSFDDRLKARRRLASGTHVPHPGIAQQRTAAVQLHFDRPTPIWLDGEAVGSATDVSVRVEPDRWTAVV
jgi:diacylglycerol kinase family enzyme